MRERRLQGIEGRWLVCCGFWPAAELVRALLGPCWWRPEVEEGWPSQREKEEDRLLARDKDEMVKRTRTAGKGGRTRPFDRRVAAAVTGGGLRYGRSTAERWWRMAIGAGVVARSSMRDSPAGGSCAHRWWMVDARR